MMLAEVSEAKQASVESIASFIFGGGSMDVDMRC